MRCAARKPLAEFVEFMQRFAFQIARGPQDEPLEPHAAQPVADRGLQHSQDLSDTRLPTPDPISCVRGSGESGDQGAVHIEERPHLGSRRARCDLCDPTR